ncbi:hypothetical protein [Streptomyces sp. N2A]|uniref:hypothetical protein n=1 Tax=Streptomyces sp. N2A TaxID=3073936 RepID=UPI00286FE716|nr:hypothetical protein [Streptomyces sp. N2A]
MHISHIPLYALAAGGLAVSVLLFGDGDGADAATDAVSEAAGGAASKAASGLAPDASGAVTVRPERVAPGGAFSVYDGGVCAGGSAEARFDSPDIPVLRLSAMADQAGATAVLPQGVAPGTYRVTVVCGGARGTGQHHAVYQAARAGQEDGGGRKAAKSATGTLTVTGGALLASPVSDGAGAFSGGSASEDAAQADDVLSDGSGLDDSGLSDDSGPYFPQGGSRTGLGGTAGHGGDRTAAVLGGLALLGAAGWGASAHRRRARRAQG